MRATGSGYNAASFFPTPFPPDANTPPELRAQLDTLEQWAKDNKRDATKDAVFFWTVKIGGPVLTAHKARSNETSGFHA